MGSVDSTLKWEAAGEPVASGLARVGTLMYGILCYLSFLAVLLYAVGFVGNWYVPKSIDSGTSGPMGATMLLNAALLSVFVVQHTIMARPPFKRWWTRFVPQCLERSTFVLLASASLALMFWQWRPLPGVIWKVEGTAGVLLVGLSLAGYVLAVGSSFIISHFDLFGLRQTWLHFRGEPYTPVGFRLAGVYRWVRHPLMVGFLVGFWATPVMTAGHLLFALLTTGYILFGTWIEERTLIAEHGERYLAYRRSVPAFVPRVGRRS